MKSISNKTTAHRRTSKAAMSVAFMVALTLLGVPDLKAQRPASLTLDAEEGNTTDIPNLWGHWRKDGPKYGDRSNACGGILSANGAPLEACQIPIDKMRPYMHPRLLAWMQFAGTTDEYLSPKHGCVAASLLTSFGDPYTTSISRNADKVIIHYEMGNRNREIWTDGRKHTPASESFYMGHAVGWFENGEFVVDTTNFTFDPDGFDDHAHLATSHMKHVIERYKMTDKDHITLTITVEDPLFLKQPFTYNHYYARTDNQPVTQWECNVETAQDELHIMAPDKYEGK